MRSAWRTLDAATLRAVVVMCLSVLVIGASYGVAAHSAGLALWQIVLIATVVLAGSSEFVFVGVLAAGGVPVVAAVAGLLVNTRNFGYGLAVGKHLRRLPEMLLGAHLINDETAALTTAESEPRRARAAFLLCGLGILVCWPVGAGLGAVLGSSVASPEALGLDAAFPALLAALAVPALRTRATWAAVAVGGAVAVASTPFLPAGLPILCALAGFAGVEAVRRLRNPQAESLSPQAEPLPLPVERHSSQAEPLPLPVERHSSQAEPLPLQVEPHSSQAEPLPLLVEPARSASDEPCRNHRGAPR